MPNQDHSVGQPECPKLVEHDIALEALPRPWISRSLSYHQHGHPSHQGKYDAGIESDAGPLLLTDFFCADRIEEIDGGEAAEQGGRAGEGHGHALRDGEQNAKAAHRVAGG
jgi:hypothetical protein